MVETLIIRSASETLLKEALQQLKAEPKVHVLSDRLHSDIEACSQSDDLIVESESLRLKYEARVPLASRVLILLDLQRYSLNSYGKFVQFAYRYSQQIEFYHQGRIVSIDSWAFKSLAFKGSGKWIGLLAMALLGGLKALSKIYPLKVCDMRVDRIGHLAINAETYWRQKKLSKDRSHWLVFIDPKSAIANEQLLAMFSRLMHIVRSSWGAKLCRHPLIRMSRHFVPLATWHDRNVWGPEYNICAPSLKWTPTEKHKAQAMLKQLGVDSWFVCFHNRDPEYLKAHFTVDTSYHDYRNSDIQSYYQAMDWVTKQGGYAIRMGHLVSKPLDTKGNPKIIDYAQSMRSDFMDIYLMAHCRFALASTAGLYLVSTIFNVPVAICNGNAFQFGYSQHERMIPKLLVRKEDQQLVPFEELYEGDNCALFKQSDYDQRGFALRDNSSDEILKLTEEMYQMTEGTLRYSVEDDQRQERLRSIYRKNRLWYYDYPSRIGRDFLQKHEQLFSQKSPSF